MSQQENGAGSNGDLPSRRRSGFGDPCSIDGCERLVKAMGLCNRHYLKLKRYGDPLYIKQYDKNYDWPARFWRKVNFGLLNDCWLWTGATTGGKFCYGQTNYNKKNIVAHRVSYELQFGNIQPDLEIDHKCRNRLCVNPFHLEPVTRKINMERARKEFCKNGHLLEGNNIYEETKNGKVTGRKCRVCRRNRYDSVARKNRYYEGKG